MTFAQASQDKELVRALAGMVDSGRVPHAILFDEDDGGGGLALCVAFLQYLYCRNRSGGDSCGSCPACNRVGRLIHPDVHLIFPTSASRTSLGLMAEFRSLFESNPFFKEDELVSALKLDGKNTLIPVAESRALMDALSLSALEGGYRCVIIYLPEKMNAEAANKLLKLLEEPPALTQFMFVSHKPERLLPTIASRCLRIRLGARKKEPELMAFDSPELFSELMDALLSKNLLSCIETGERIAALPSRESAKAFCRYAADNIRHIFLCQQGLEGGLTADVSRWAGRCPKTFPRKALAVLDRAQSLVDRNVNLRILFTDMADRLFLLI